MTERSSHEENPNSTALFTEDATDLPTDACVLETPVMTLTTTIMTSTTLSWSSCFAFIITLMFKPMRKALTRPNLIDEVDQKG